MIVLIILINLLITLLNVYLALKIWQLRQIIARITLVLVNCESYFKTLLFIAPQVIYQGQINLRHFQQRYRLIQLRLQQIQQVILLLNWSYQIWRRYVSS